VISFMLKDNCVKQTSSAKFRPEGNSTVGCAALHFGNNQTHAGLTDVARYVPRRERLSCGKAFLFCFDLTEWRPLVLW
jgi:hypothetical protein